MRSIIPVYEESTGLILENKNSCLDFLKMKTGESETLSQLNIIASGDAERLMYGYADSKEESAIKEKRLALKSKEQELKTKKSFFFPGELMEGSTTYNITAGEYNYKQNEIKSSAKLVGYHRQKSRLLVEDGLLISAEKLELSYVMLKKKNRGAECNIYIAKGSTLILRNVIMDAISVTVEDGAKLILDSVEFKGGLSAVSQLGNGVVERVGSVEFTSVAYEYDFEFFAKETAVNIIDYDKHKDIIDFIRKSKAKNFSIYKDIDFRGDSDIKFNTEFSFLNTTDGQLNVYMNKALVSNTFGSSQKISFIGDVEVRDSEGATVSIKEMYGTVTAIDSSNIIVNSSHLLTQKESIGIMIERSSVAIIDSTVEGVDRSDSSGCIAIELLDSKVELQNVILKKVKEAIKPKVVKKDEDAIWSDHESGSSIYFNALKIDDVEVAMHSNGEIFEMIGKLMIVQNSHDGFVLKKTNFKVEDIIMQKLTGKALSFSESNVGILGKNTIIENVESSLELKDRTAAEVGNGVFLNISESPAVSIENSIFIAHGTRFKEVGVAVHALEEGLFVNNRASFESVTSAIEKAHGARAQMDYSEYLIEIGERSDDE